MIHIKHVNYSLGIGLVNYREAYDITCAFPELLHAEIYKGNLVFRKKRSTQRISYMKLKKGLMRQQIILYLQPLPF